MTIIEKPEPELVKVYASLFVNRLAYTIQSSYPDSTGRHKYYRPTKRHDGSPISLTLETVARHMEGAITIGLYPSNPNTNRSKWVAIDADYESAVEDLLKLQWELKEDGVEAALEKSRRGGHLWIFAEKPLPARDCLLYISNLASRLKVPFRKGGLVEGIEVFPRKELGLGEFGNGIRGPLGVHKGANQRYWFYGANYSLAAQINYLRRLKKITEEELAGFVKGMTMPEEFAPKPKLILPPYNPNRREFHILDYVKSGRRQGGDYRTTCPSCAQSGGDKKGHHLAISVRDPRLYRCWAGCSKEQIRAALGCPIRKREAS